MPPKKDNDHDLLIRIDERLKSVETHTQKAEGRGWQDMAFRFMVLVLSLITITDKTGVEVGLQDVQDTTSIIIGFLVGR